MVRNSLGSLVRSFGYRASLFARGQDFLDTQPDRFCCLISDVNMPEMNGLDLQNALKTQAPALPVLFLTAFPTPTIREQAMAAGARMFLEKPIDPDDLHRVLRLVLENPAGGAPN